MAQGKHSVRKNGANTSEQAPARLSEGAGAPGRSDAHRGVSHRQASKQRPAASSRLARPARRPGRSHGPLIALIVAILVVAAGVFVFYSCTREQPAEVRTGEEITIEVPSGSSADSIAQLLKDNGVIATTGEFSQRVSELGDEAALKSGTYRFTGGQSVDEIISDLCEGESGYWVTIPEGYTLEQISKRVQEATGGQVSAKKLYKLAHTGAKRYEKSFPFLKNCYKGSMEGFLFPETYRVKLNATADDVVVQMLSEFKSQADGLDLSYAQSKGFDLYDVTTLASIIEKESRMSGDKSGISAVFYNRLHAKMNLGSDVTTYYAVGKKLTDTLTKKDLASKSPYNTRNAKSRGLPPGAICNPGLEALEAAANPDKDSKDLYFFWSESQNQTMFFESAADFDAAWKKYGQ